MKITVKDIEDNKILETAKQQFPECVIKINTTDLFMKEVEDGEYTCSFLEQPIYISTQYAYEDILVNGNPTRYKICVSTIELLDSEYSINYSWNDKYFVVYLEDGQMKFMEYEKFLEFIKQEIHRIEQ